MHSRSFSNPVFQAQYSRDVLPEARSSLDMFREARSCPTCHAPIVAQSSLARLTTLEQIQASAAGVTCDFCHTITGHRGEQPGNGNYVTEPGYTKYGPLQAQTDWHHQYSELQTRSEFCAICHSVRNQLGLDVKSTYAEWRASRYAAEGIQCQDCHMTVNGFLSYGRPLYERGQAASMTLSAPLQREKLYTHRFQGARSRTQIEGAIQLAFETPAPPANDVLEVRLRVDNSRTGHRMPSGSVDLRYMWLDVCALIGDQRVALTPVNQPGSEGYDVTGAHEELDESVLAGAVPPGRRIYRTLLADSRGATTLAFYLAKRVLFDNRLNASEVRVENYRLKLPGLLPPRLTVLATMYYAAYPDAFAARLKLPKAEPVVVASAKTQVQLGREGQLPARIELKGMEDKLTAVP
jgi:nitrate/TMAO reductase-like tetraheme cytochrome c subunit